MSDLCEYAIVAYFRIFCRIFHDYMVCIFLKKVPHKTDMPKLWEALTDLTEIR